MKFLSATADYHTARFVLFGLPDDRHVSYRRGARKGPKALRAASDSIETYSPYCDADLNDLKIHDAGNWAPDGRGEKKYFRRVTEKVARLAGDGKVPLALGGDHSLTYAVVAGLAEVHQNFDILQLDAHCDLREAYNGTVYSHASVMYRCGGLRAVNRIYQLGLRSGTHAEFQKANLYPLTPEGLARLSGQLRRPLYITVDVDFFDPAHVPGTGTPECGGYNFDDFLNVLRTLGPRNVIGADIMELAPSLDPTGRSPVFAAKVAREFLLFMGGAVQSG